MQENRESQLHNDELPQAQPQEGLIAVAEIESVINGAVSVEEKERMAVLVDFEKTMNAEVLKLVMGKVQDIGTDGIAYSRLLTLVDRSPASHVGGDRLAEELYKINPKIGEIKAGEFHEQREKLIDQYLFPRQLNKSLKNLETIFEKGIVAVEKEFRWNQMRENLAKICGVDVEEIKEMWKQGGRDRVIEFAWSKGISLQEVNEQMEGLEESAEQMNAKDYKKMLKKKREAGEHSLVHFNITGRAFEWPDQKYNLRRSVETRELLEIGSTNWTGRHDTVTVMFDISDLTETYPGPKGRFDLGREELFPKTYTVASVVDTPVYSEELENRKFEEIFRLENEEESNVPGEKYEIKRVMKPRSEFGFITPTRIPPRKFQGLVYSVIKRDHVKRYDSEKQKFYDGTDYYTDEELTRLAKNIAATMVDADKSHPELIVPIYDSKGNLLWPKQMSYEEVKKFVAERDAEKETEK